MNVGWYRDASQNYHGLLLSGFVLANGVYKTVDSPHANRTFLNDINASGVIVGTYHNTPTGARGGFIYVHGTFKDVKEPRVQVSTFEGINVYGYVTGTSSGGSFTAHCQQRNFGRWLVSTGHGPLAYRQSALVHVGDRVSHSRGKSISSRRPARI